MSEVIEDHHCVPCDIALEAFGTVRRNKAFAATPDYESRQFQLCDAVGELGRLEPLVTPFDETAYQPGLEHFGDERGFLAYTKVGRTALVLSDPLAPRENIPDLIARFVKEHPDAGFWYLTHPVAEIFARSGFLVNAMGHDTWIDLSTYTFSGAKKEQLRRASTAWSSAVSSPASAR